MGELLVLPFAAIRPDGVVPQLHDAAVLIGPRCWTCEAVIFDRIHREIPVRLAQFDQALCEAHDVLEVHIRVDHAV